MMTDGYGRIIRYARISATDLCDLRCLYCMPGGCVKKSHGDILPLEDLNEISRALADLGANKQRVTGGEPLVRRGITALLEMMGANEKIDNLSLTTNGQRLPEMAEAVWRAGVRNVNVSLDTLDAEKYRFLTGGGDIRNTLRGIDRALETGFNVKLNAVLLKDVNDSEVRDLAVFAKGKGVPVRFIEIMPFPNQRDFAGKHFLSPDDVVRKHGLRQTGRKGKSLVFEFPDGTPVEFISAISHKFCWECDRVRITADGKLINCLHEAKEYDLKPYIGDSDALKNFITDCVRKKPAGHNLDKGILQKRCMEDIGG